MIQLSQQVISYFNRLQALDQTRSNSLARHAFAEQRTKKLTWYQNTIKILEIAGHHHTSNASPTHIKSKLQEHFNNLWEAERHKSSKLSYYNEVKRTPHIHYEVFLDLVCAENRKCLMRLRSSSHRFNCETGRYITDKNLMKSNATKDFTNHEQSSTKKPNLFCLGTKITIFSIINPILEDSADSSGRYSVYVSQRRQKETPYDSIQQQTQ